MKTVMTGLQTILANSGLKQLCYFVYISFYLASYFFINYCYFSYLVNISFYLALKASKEDLKSHPIVDVLWQHKQVRICQLSECIYYTRLETNQIY